MAVPSVDPRNESQPDQYPLLMSRTESHNDPEHVVDVTEAPAYQTTYSDSSNRLNFRSASHARRGTPVNYGIWISVELLITTTQIIASAVVLSLSRHENPEAPLFVWVIGYACGCALTLPLLYWRHRNQNRGANQDLSQHNSSSDATYTAITVDQVAEEENNLTTVADTSNTQVAGGWISRLNGLADHFKMGLDCFFAVWFVVGNVWIFGGHSSPEDAPILYRLCIVFLTFSCIGYAMPFVLCTTICCCLPCIISVLGFREDLSQSRGATSESINALPTYKFKSEKKWNDDDQDASSDAVSGGIFAAGTEKERVISGEDAVCCICLVRYGNDEELRELPCTHFFHVECVDKWLKINALCPLCKFEVGDATANSQSAA